MAIIPWGNAWNQPQQETNANYQAFQNQDTDPGWRWRQFQQNRNGNGFGNQQDVNRFPGHRGFVNLYDPNWMRGPTQLEMMRELAGIQGSVVPGSVQNLTPGPNRELQPGRGVQKGPPVAVTERPREGQDPRITAHGRSARAGLNPGLRPIRNLLRNLF